MEATIWQVLFGESLFEFIKLVRLGFRWRKAGLIFLVWAEWPIPYPVLFPRVPDYSQWLFSYFLQISWNNILTLVVLINRIIIAFLLDLFYRGNVGFRRHVVEILSCFVQALLLIVIVRMTVIGICGGDIRFSEVHTTNIFLKGHSLIE